MAEYPPKLTNSSPAKFWWGGGQFGVKVDDPEKHLKMWYTANRDIVMSMPPPVEVELPPVKTSALSKESEDSMRGKLCYESPPKGEATGTMQDVKDDSGKHRLYVVFQNAKPGEKEATNTIAEFQGDLHPDIFILKSGVGDWQTVETTE